MWCLPSRQASRLLAAAIARNGWRFTGTGHFSVQHGRPTTFSISVCPVCRGATSTMPYCDFYAGTFERLFARLIHPRTRAWSRSAAKPWEDPLARS
jgi:divinyl protochlorophyllide a 8-vinyl-reductase